LKQIDPIFFENPESHIPNGYYCYTLQSGTRTPCPFYDTDETKDHQEDGYCHYLHKGDNDFNHEGGILVDMKTGERKEMVYSPFNGLLWDQVKHCKINEFEDEE
jgi:hypothetical protein